MGGCIAKIAGSIDIEPKTNGPIIGTISRIDKEGKVWVDFPGNSLGPIGARMSHTVANRLSSMIESRLPPVILLFEEDDRGRPMIIDLVCDRIIEKGVVNFIERNDVEDVRVDGQTITFDAKKEIVLRCGKASITLTSSGKVLIRGSYLLNRSTGANRIKGGSVQIN